RTTGEVPDRQDYTTRRSSDLVGEHRPTRQKQLLDTALPRLQHRTGGTLLRYRRGTGRSRCHHCPFSNAEGRALREGRARWWEGEVRQPGAAGWTRLGGRVAGPTASTGRIRLAPEPASCRSSEPRRRAGPIEAMTGAGRAAGSMTEWVRSIAPEGSGSTREQVVDVALHRVQGLLRVQTLQQHLLDGGLHGVDDLAGLGVDDPGVD